MVEATDGDGAPVAWAQVNWSVTGKNARVEQASGLTDNSGRASAVWVLGTLVTDSQRLTAGVVLGNQEGAGTVNAVAQPAVVNSIAFLQDTTTAKVGVATFAKVQAVDPYGNRFVPSALQFTSLDTSLFTLDSTGAILGRTRGWGRMIVAAGAADTAWVHVTQIVSAIVTSPDTLRFHALGQSTSLHIRLVDDQGGPIHDSVPNDSIFSDSVISVQPGKPFSVRSVSSGSTQLLLRAGAVAQVVPVVVDQLVASVTMSAGRVTFDALGDTIQLTTSADDSTGAPLANQALAFRSADTTVVKVGQMGSVTSIGNGGAWIYARAANGVEDSLHFSVAQRVARVEMKTDSIFLDAIPQTLSAQAAAVDRLGAPMGTGSLSYSSTVPSVATVDATGSIRAVGNGRSIVTASYGPDTASLVLRVLQRAVRIVTASDSLRFVAVGDSQSVQATVVDSLGTQVGNLSQDLKVSDTSVAQLVDSLTLRARSNGTTMATLTAGSLAMPVVVVVNQIPTSLILSVASSNPVLTLAAGALFPITCQARDRNGFEIPGDSALIRSARGTVTGDQCGSARVAHSGYDTISATMGQMRAQIPVIVATRPDSVGVLFAAESLTTNPRDLYVGEDLTDPSVLALHPLVADIMAAYGNPTTNLGRARAIRDWVARTAIHPYPPFHPDNSTSDLSVLPPGRTWADVNLLSLLPDSVFLVPMASYWSGVGYNGYAMLDKLLGTLDPATGVRANDGMMVHIAGARYQIRDINTYQYTICTYQAIIASALWAAAGLQGMLISTVAHDPSAVFIPELGHWVYEDPTFNEEYTLDGAGNPLSPADVLAISTANEASRLQATKFPGPDFDPQTYNPDVTYINGGHPQGFVIMGSQLNERVVGVVGPGGWPVRLVQINVPQLALEPPFNNELSYDPVTPPVAFPTLGVVVQPPQAQDSAYVIALSSTYPGAQSFQRSVNGSAWQTVSSSDVLPVGQCQVAYRSVDAGGNFSASTILSVWVPRGPGFTQSGPPGGVRRQAATCD